MRPRFIGAGTRSGRRALGSGSVRRPVRRRMAPQLSSGRGRGVQRRRKFVPASLARHCKIRQRTAGDVAAIFGGMMAAVARNADGAALRLPRARRQDTRLRLREGQRKPGDLPHVFRQPPRHGSAVAGRASRGQTASRGCDERGRWGAGWMAAPLRLSDRAPLAMLCAPHSPEPTRGQDAPNPQPRSCGRNSFAPRGLGRPGGPARPSAPICANGPTA